MRRIVRGQQVNPAKVKRAKELRREMTEEERMLWQHLRGNRLRGMHFRRQQVIDGFIVDFYCHKAGLVVEVDGKIHEKQVEYDKWRDQILADRGLHILRIPNEDIRQGLAGVLQRLSALLT